jgi:pyridoxine/pyridoxamine 5'-phosphate oxidase
MQVPLQYKSVPELQESVEHVGQVSTAVHCLVAAVYLYPKLHKQVPLKQTEFKVPAKQSDEYWHCSPICLPEK